jgi:hypothetical protein
MGYTLELWAGSVARVEDELRQPAIDPARLAPGARPDGITATWSEDAAYLAAAIAAGGGAVDEKRALHVGFVVRHLGHHYGALSHTSSGGDEFRRRFLPGPATQRFGFDAMAKLVNRPLAALSWSAYPVIGWLNHNELVAAAATANAQPWPEQDDGDAEPLAVLDRVVNRCADVGLDLLGLYW